MVYIADTFHLIPKKKCWVFNINGQCYISDKSNLAGPGILFLFDDGVWYNGKTDVTSGFVIDHCDFPNFETAKQFAEDHNCAVEDIIVL